MVMRAFRTTFLVAIDEETVSDEDRAAGFMSVDLDEVADYLADGGLQLSWNDEDCGNPCGVVSMEIDLDGLVELPAAEVKKLYGEKPGVTGEPGDG